MRRTRAPSPRPSLRPVTARVAAAIALAAAALAPACGGSHPSSPDASAGTPDARPGTPDAPPPDGATASLDAICGPGGLAVAAFDAWKGCRPDSALVFGAATDPEVSAACYARYQGYVTDGTLVVGDSAAIAACQAFIASATCATLDAGAHDPCTAPAFSARALARREPLPPGGGGAILAGTVALGGGCFDDVQCAGDAFCDPAGAVGTFCDACAARKATSAPCDVALGGRDCSSGICLGGACQAPVGAGGACATDVACAGALVCRDAICQPQATTATAGMACVEDDDCATWATGLYCTDDHVASGGARSCRAPAAVGASCQATSGQPQVVCDKLHGDACDATNHCAAPTTITTPGASCGLAEGRRCGAGLICAGVSVDDPYGPGTCQAVRAAGAACATGVCAAGLVCNAFTTTCTPTHAHPLDVCTPPPENCSNGVDDDGDGLIDCADPDCAGTAACPAPALGGWSFATGPSNGDERFALIAAGAAGHAFLVGVPDALYQVTASSAGPLGASATGATWSNGFRAVYDAVPVAGGGLVGVTGGADVDLITFSSTGAITATHRLTYPSNQSRQPFAIAVDPAGGYVVAGRVVGDGNAFVTRVDAGFAVVSDREVASSTTTAASTSIVRLIAAPGGGFYAAGATDAAPMLMKLGADGSITWQRRLAPPPAGGTDFYSGVLRDLAVLGDGSVIAVGEQKLVHVAGGTFTTTTAMLAARYDATGALAWQRVLATAAGDATARAVVRSTHGGTEHVVIGGSGAGGLLLVDLAIDGAAVNHASVLALGDAEALVEDAATGQLTTAGRMGNAFTVGVVDAALTTGACTLAQPVTVTDAAAAFAGATPTLTETAATATPSTPTLTATAGTATVTGHCP